MMKSKRSRMGWGIKCFFFLMSSASMKNWSKEYTKPMTFTASEYLHHRSSRKLTRQQNKMLILESRTANGGYLTY
jgi:hypothetical protein